MLRKGVMAFESISVRPKNDSVGQARENTSTAFSLPPYGDDGFPLPEL